MAPITRASLFVFLLSFALACNGEQSDTQEVTTSSPPSETISIEYGDEDLVRIDGRVLSASDTLARLHGIQKVGSYLLVADFVGKPPAHVLRAEDGRYLSALGEPGEGPGEFLSISSFDVTAPERGSVWAYDLSALRLTHVSLPEYVEGTDALGDSLVTLEIGYTLTTPHWLGDSLLVSPGFLTEEGRLAYVDPETGETHRIAGVPPPNPDGHPTAVVQHAYQASMDDHPERPLLALATRYADRIEIYQASGERQTLVRGPDHFDPIYEVRTMSGEPVRASTDETRSGYLDVEATASSIYALYSGRFQDERYSGSGRFVHVLDWTGELQTVYKLDEPTRAITVDEAAERLYTARIVPEPAVVSYDLNGASTE